MPTFVFLTECLEHRKWRYEGADVAEVVKRLRRVAAGDRLDDGPDAEAEDAGPTRRTAYPVHLADCLCVALSERSVSVCVHDCVYRIRSG